MKISSMSILGRALLLSALLGHTASFLPPRCQRDYNTRHLEQHKLAVGSGGYAIARFSSPRQWQIGQLSSWSITYSDQSKYKHKVTGTSLFTNAPFSSPSSFSKTVSFTSPLLEAGYPPAVEEYKDGTLKTKPLLLYLPGFDGTVIAPFLQFPELSTEFDVRGMAVEMEDRSTLEELKEGVLDYIQEVLIEKEAEDLKLKDTVADSGLSTISNSNKEENMGNSQNITVKSDVPKANTTKSPSQNPFMSFLNNITDKKSSGSAETSKLKSEKKKLQSRPVYLMGESFGGILALEVALALKDQSLQGVKSASKVRSMAEVNLEGIVLINPATCYDRSKLAAEGPDVAKLPSPLYPFGLLRLLPIFTDAYAVPQLFLMLQSKALPSVIDTAAREAYMGRTAFSLPQKLKFMPKETLQWRLEEWLTKGCESISQKENQLKNNLNSVPVLVVAGEMDKALPSISEAERLMDIFDNVDVHVVEGAGHANTSGSRVDITAIMRGRFSNLVKRRKKRGDSTGKQKVLRRTAMKEVAASGFEEYFGMEPRYDNAKIGLSPLLYWSEENYLQVKKLKR